MNNELVWKGRFGEYLCGWLMLLWFCAGRIVCPSGGDSSLLRRVMQVVYVLSKYV